MKADGTNQYWPQADKPPTEWQADPTALERARRRVDDPQYAAEAWQAWQEVLRERAAPR